MDVSKLFRANDALSHFELERNSEKQLRHSGTVRRQPEWFEDYVNILM